MVKALKCVTYVLTRNDGNINLIMEILTYFTYVKLEVIGLLQNYNHSSLFNKISLSSQIHSNLKFVVLWNILSLQFQSENEGYYAIQLMYTMYSLMV